MDINIDLTKELQAMNDGTLTAAPGTEAPTTDPPKDETTDAPSTDAPSTDAPATDAPSTDAPATDAPSTEAPTTEAPDEDDELAKAQMRIAELEALQNGIDVGTNAPSTKAPPTSAPTTDAPEEDVDFVGTTEMDDLTRDPQILNKVLNLVLKRGIEQGKMLKENVLRSIPNVISHTVAQQTALRNATDNFYSDNPDLATPDRKKIVAVTAEKVIAKNPQFTLDKMLEETEKLVRGKLKLKKEAVKRDRKPAFGKKKQGGGHRKGQEDKPKLTEMQKEINAMNDSDK